MASYQHELKAHSVDTSFENLLLFLLSYVSRSNERDVLELQLRQMYSFALLICNSLPADDVKVQKYSLELRKLLEE